MRLAADDRQDGDLGAVYGGEVPETAIMPRDSCNETGQVLPVAGGTVN